MPSPNDNTLKPSSALQALLATARRHYAPGNVVKVVITQRTGGDADLGQGGTVTPDKRVLNPEPCLGAISVNAVLASGGALRYSDLKMSVVKDAMTEAEYRLKELEFEINGSDRTFIVVAFTPNPSTIEFVIRRKQVV